MKIDSPTFLTETTFISASVSFASGSNRFGNTLDDVQQFTGSVSISGSFNLSGDITEDGVSYNEQFNYLRKQYVKKASSISVPSTASFTAVTASSPTSLTTTSEDDFMFFLNGQYMEHDALTIQQAGSSLLLKVNNDSIGYDLESDDEIIAWGKFNS